MAKKSKRRIRSRTKTPKKKVPKEEDWKISEEPLLLDDPGGSPLEWLELGMRQPVRLGASRDPWVEDRLGPDSDALTERRRRKLQSLSLSREEETGEESGESVA